MRLVAALHVSTQEEGGGLVGWPEGGAQGVEIIPFPRRWPGGRSNFTCPLSDGKHPESGGGGCVPRVGFLQPVCSFSTEHRFQERLAVPRELTTRRTGVPALASGQSP